MTFSLKTMGMIELRPFKKKLDTFWKCKRIVSVYKYKHVHVHPMDCFSEIV